MKKTGIIAIATAGIVALGGGAWAVTTLPASSDGTVASAPVETSEPTVTPTVEPSVTPEPEVAPTVEPTSAPTEPAAIDEIDDIYLPWARENYDWYVRTTPTLPEMTDDELIMALDVACGSLIDGDVPPDLSVVPGFDTAADLDPETWEDEANRMFTSAAEIGYGPNITGEAGSYCD